MAFVAEVRAAPPADSLERLTDDVLSQPFPDFTRDQCTGLISAFKNDERALDTLPPKTLGALGRALFAGSCAKMDDRLAFDLLKRAGRGGSNLGLMGSGLCLALGVGTPVDTNGATRWFHEFVVAFAGVRRSVAAKYDRYYLAAFAVAAAPASLQTQIDWINGMETAGPDTLYAEARKLTGADFRPSHAAAIRDWLHRAASLGHARAAYDLGTYYRDDRYVYGDGRYVRKRPPLMADYYLNIAARLSYPPAQAALARLYVGQLQSPTPDFEPTDTAFWAYVWALAAKRHGQDTDAEIKQVKAALSAGELAEATKLADKF